MKSLLWKLIVVCCVVANLCSASHAVKGQNTLLAVASFLGVTIFTQPVYGDDATVAIDSTGNIALESDPELLVAKNRQAVVIKNDDYCDDLKTGSDEDQSAACSFYMNYNPKLLKAKLASKPAKVQYVCRENLVLNMTIPVSRINDGVCDCCDGIDEINSPFSIECPNTCELSLHDLRKQALTYHRNIQSGLRIKNDLIYKFKQIKQRDQKSYENLLQERKEMSTMYVNMEYLLVNYEKGKEESLRWSLLHDRLHQCSMGNDEICQNLFYSSYYNDKELDDEGIPGIYLNPKKRFVYEYSNQEKEYLLRLKGIERIQQTICFVKDLLPDEDSRIFTRIHEYLSFMDSPGGKLVRESQLKAKVGSGPGPNAAGGGGGGGGGSVGGNSKGSHKGGGSSSYSMKNNNIKFKRTNTLFGKYLENGEKGYLRLQIVLLEYIGITLSPITLPIQGLAWIWSSMRSRLWSDIQRLAHLYDHSNPQHNTNDLGIEGLGKDWDITNVEALGQALSIRKSLNTGNKKLPNTDHLPKPSSIHIPPTTWKESILQSLSIFANWIISIEEPGSFLHDLWYNQLDLTRFSLISRYQDMIMSHPLIVTPTWMYNVITRAPLMYIQYYLLQAGEQLPPRRHACLLRQGLKTARHEMNQLDERIRQEEEMKELLQRENNENLMKKRREQEEEYSSGSSLAARRKAKKRGNMEESEEGSSGGLVNGIMSTLSGGGKGSTSSGSGIDGLATGSSWMIDYGIDSSWEVLHRQCIWKILPEYEEDEQENNDIEHHKKKERYNYTFCLFDDIKQGDTSLGMFHLWGADMLPAAAGGGISGTPVSGTVTSNNKNNAKEIKRLQKYLQKIQYQKEKAQLEMENMNSMTNRISNRLVNGIVLDMKALMNSFEDIPETVTTYLSNTVFPSAQWVEEQRVFLQNVDHPLVSYLIDMLQYVSINDDDEEGGLVTTSTSTSSEQGAINRNKPNPIDGKAREDILKEQLHRYYSSQLYDSGTLCAVRPGFKRRTVVYFDCGSEFKITDVLETQTCEYEMRVSCPLACTSFLEEKSVKQLDQLGVFGFSKTPQDSGVSSRQKH